MTEAQTTKYSERRSGVASPFILDLSKKTRERNHGGGKIQRYGFKKIIGLSVLFALFALAVFGWNFYKQVGDIKWKILNARAIDEAGLAEINELLDIIKYLPATGETGKIKELAADFENFKNILGFDWPKKYLLVFQNPSETRATGGFIGSVGIMDVAKGKIRNIGMSDVYGLDGQLRVNVEPPEPIKKISASWSLHDANWFFNFPDSARKISWFYEKAGGETVDGVIAINPEAVRKILSVTGPVKLEKYNLELDEKNFTEEIQRQVETSYDKTVNQPKLVLADFLKELKQKMENLPLGEKISVIKGLSLALEQKDIQIFFNGGSQQEFISSHGWAGQIKQTDKDYLAIVHSNINGFKSDAVMEESASLVSKIDADGSVINTLTISRKNFGGNSRDEWYNKVNSDYLRIYVPQGAKLLSASGTTKELPFIKDPATDYSQYIKDDILTDSKRSAVFDDTSGVEIFTESGKTVFGSWVYTSPGEKTVVSFRYLLPFKIDFNDFSSQNDSYTLLFQKQSGSKLEKLNHEIIFPATWKAANQPVRATDFFSAEGRVKKILDIRADKFAGIVFSKSQRQ